MPRSPEDTAWFRANPGRLYRLEPVSSDEAAKWPSPPPIGHTAWRIIRFEDGARGNFQTSDPTGPQDRDGSLGHMLARIRREG